jgi:hypothetical protein
VCCSVGEFGVVEQLPTAIAIRTNVMTVFVFMCVVWFLVR